jgi:hypothetical protein
MVASHFPHFGEEDCLRGWKGSGTIFFSGCNLRCVFCLPPDALIATADGPREIRNVFEAATDEIALGDGAVRRPAGVCVHTVTGELAPVSKAFRRPHRGELVRVKAANAPALGLTPTHKVYAAHRSDPDRIEKVAAGSLTRDHYLVVPKLRPTTRETHLQVEAVLAEHVSAAVRAPRRRVDEQALVTALATPRTSSEIARDLGYHPTYVRLLRSKLRTGTLFAVPGAAPRKLQTENGSVRFAGEHRPGIPRSLPLDEELSWLLGFYCAEGHVTRVSARPNSYRLVFSSGRHEEKLVRHVARQLSRLFGVTASVVERRTTLTVEAGKTSLALLFSTLCGTGARAKRVPGPIFDAPEEVLRAFLDGYLAGDGTETPTHRVANTVSSELAHGLYQVGLRLNVLPSIHRWEPPPGTTIEGRSVRQAPLWYVKFKRDRLNGTALPSERARWKDAGSYFLSPIQSIEREPYEGSRLQPRGRPPDPLVRRSGRRRRELPELRRQLEGPGRGGLQRAAGPNDARAPAARLSQHQLGHARARRPADPRGPPARPGERPESPHRLQHELLRQPRQPHADGGRRGRLHARRQALDA